MKGWLAWAAMALASGILGASLWPAHVLRGALFGLAFVCVVGAFINLLAEKRRSRYDLGELRHVHEQAELDAIDVPGPEEFDSVRCQCCGSVYSMRLPVCPQCRRSQFQ